MCKGNVSRQGIIRLGVKWLLLEIILFSDDFRVEEFYVAPAVKDGNEDVAAEVYASSGKYIDPVSFRDVGYIVLGVSRIRRC